MIRRPARAALSWIVAAVCLAAGAGAVGIFAWHYLRPVVTVTQAVEGPVVQAFYATGTVSPVTEHPIKAQVAGIVTPRVDKGDAVAAGQLLAEVVDPEMRFKLDKARAELDEKVALADEEASPVLKEFDARIAATQDLLAIAQREEKRVTGLLEKGTAAQADLDRSLDRVKQLWSDLESLKAQRDARKLALEREVKVARAAVETAEWNVRQQQVLSPIAGVVLDRPTPQGTRVAVNDHLMQVADVAPANLVMRAQVDEEDRNRLREGQKVQMTLYAFPDRVFIGRVQRIYPKADENRKTFEVDVRPELPASLPADAPVTLAAGMTGELAFVVAEKAAEARAIVVPSQAVQDGAIWTVTDGRLVRLDATLGLRGVERTEVLTGLSPGQLVVIGPVASLSPGQPVRTKMIEPRTAAGLNKPKDAQVFRGFN